MICIVPCCGESTRFKGLKKQFLTHPLGLPLPIYSASGLTGVKEFVFVFKRDEFCDRFGVFGESFTSHLCKIDMPGRFILLDHQTASQVETVDTALSLIPDLGPFYVKDCDNYFETAAWPNSVAVIHVQDSKFEVRNKSFSRGNPITEIKERVLISPWANVGGYGFADQGQFHRYSTERKSISEVIQTMINAGVGKFSTEVARYYEDYGTHADWINYLKKFTE